MTIGAITAALMMILPMLPVLAQLAVVLNLTVFVGGVYYGMKRFRSEVGGSIGYLKIAFAGIQTAFFASLILAFVNYVMTKAIDPSSIDLYQAAVEQRLKTSGLPSEVEASYTQMMSEMLTPGFISCVIIMMYTAMGTALALIAGVFMRDDKISNQAANS